MAYNRNLFRQESFGADAFQKDSYIEWIPLDALNTVVHRYKIQYQTLNSQDKYWLSRSDVYEYYNLFYYKSIAYYFEPEILNGVMIEVDSDTRYTIR